MDLVVWLILVIVFSAIEAYTMDLSSIWFAFGAVFAMLAGLITSSVIIQITVFICFSLVFMIFLKPIAKRYLFTKPVKTNFDRIIGGVGLVTETIALGTGVVKVDGKLWSAQNVNPQEMIQQDSVVEILAIEGVKLIVKEQ